jgi:hypothetical protein
MGKALGTIGGVVGGIGGAIFGGPAGAAAGYSIGSGLGSALGGGSGGQVQGYYSGAAGQQYGVGQQAAAMAQFRPIGITTRFGTSTFGDGTAGYTPSQELLTLQNFYSQNALAGRADTERLLSLGRGYLAESPQEAQNRYYQQQRALLAPGEEQALGRIRSNLLSTGRGGLAVGQGGALAAANPELQAYYNAIATRDLQLATEAEQAAQQRIKFGQGLLSTAYSPVSTPYSQVAALEQLAQSPLDIGAQLGGRSATAGANAGRLLAEGGLAAAQTGLAGNIAGAGITASRNTALNQTLGTIFQNPKVGEWFGGLFPGGGFGGGGWQSALPSGISVDPWSSPTMGEYAAQSYGGLF